MFCILVKHWVFNQSDGTLNYDYLLKVKHHFQMHYSHIFHAVVALTITIL